MLNKTLKQLTLLFLVVLATLSCEKSDDEMDTSGDLLGDWELISYTSNGSTTATVQDNTLTSSFTSKALNIDYIITFSENPNRAITENGSFDVELISSVNGVNSTETTTISDINSEAGWSRNGNIITFTEDFASFNTNAPVIDEDLSTNPDYIIEELTNTSLILSTSASEQINSSGVDFDINLSLRLTFTRI
ncbi:hypothetical protein [Hyunsoonleella pacifica]|uniref:Lipocalin-like domain-containing protein n=1 Tax=Hyunsoonleella pacifica TaxID=1080224 RepID=A0A4Q9FPG7_9FLAO|nr:hypothetical protein [Hyunsoonleella pacifica]TBN15683.1 hypothetical protein EYD46_11205 [Hyunsoonleella pacifica]GGD21793.1 hypothetical protein GCM10011368_24790 [Hyunsoonleella pacifica]